MIVSTTCSNNGGIRMGELPSFARQVLLGRWFAIFVSFLVMTFAGGFYLFGYFSNDIRAKLNCDQSSLNQIGFYKDLGSNVGIVTGLLSDVAPSWVLLVIYATFNFIGYFKVWQGVTGQVPNPTLGYFSLYMAIAGNSQSIVNTVVLVTSVKNFPERRGVVLGLLKGFVGIGAAVLIQLFVAIYGRDTKTLILWIAWFPTLITLMFVFTIREIKVVKHPNEFRVFVQFLWISIILALLLSVLIFAQKRVEFDAIADTLVVIAILGLLLLPLLISIREEIVQWNLKKMTKVTRIQSTPQTPLTLAPSSTKVQQSKQRNSWFANIFDKPERGEDYTILQAILSFDMLILYLTMIIGIGSSFTAVDNLTQIGESQGYHTETINSFISVVSISNFAGRIFSGFVSEILLEKYQFPRPLMLTFTLLVSCIGHLLVAFPFHGSLLMASIVIGFALGSQIPLYFAIISEIFGLKHYSRLYNFGQLSCPIGTYVLNVLVAGNLYDQEVEKMGLHSSDGICIGDQCYRNSFTILTALTFVGAGISLILVKRTAGFYRGDIYKKFREDMESLKTEVELYPLPVKRPSSSVITIDEQSTDTKS